MILKYESYLKMIRNSVGTKMFRNLYLGVDGKKIDATQNGDFSCAYFVSNILLIWGMIKEGHANVKTTAKDMEKSGWIKIPENKIKAGDVIIWEENGRGHFHNGFYIGDKKAISNDYKKGVPTIHSWNYNGKRKIIATYRWREF